MRAAFAASLLTVVTAITFAQETDKKPAFKLSEDEEKMLELTNAERKQMELPPLKANKVLFELAREHSQNMAKQEKLDHELDCKTPFDRMKAAGYPFRRAGENIALSFGKPSMAEIVKQWMDSEGHRANILNEGFTEIGLGIAKNDKGELYFTQVFGTPLK
jgi:uncharacterized protein YkwD